MNKYNCVYVEFYPTKAVVEVFYTKAMILAFLLQPDFASGDLGDTARYATRRRYRSNH